MKKKISLFFVIIVPYLMVAQGIRPTIGSGFGSNIGNRQGEISSDNESTEVKYVEKPKYTDYKIISADNDTIHVDTTLTIKKHYKFNFRRKDNFGLLEFHNQGQTFNNLLYEFDDFSLFPDIGFRAKQFDYITQNDVNYYQVPTPTSEIMAKTGQEQGQVLDALFTSNFSRRFNVSFAYKGLRSLGQYRRSLSSTGSFRATLSYVTPKGQYGIRSHYTSQNFFNEESGGITNEMVENFKNENPDFDERGRMDTNLTDSENLFDGKRFYLDHYFRIKLTKEEVNQKNFTNLKVGHEFMNERKSYKFEQAKSDPKKAVKDSLNYVRTSNKVYLDFNSKYILGKFRVKADYTTLNYGYESILNSKSGLNKTKIKDNAISFGASWKAKLNSFYLNADAMLISGNSNLNGQYLNAAAFYKKDSLFTLKGTLVVNSRVPNYNFQFHQSIYNKYNWSNDFKNIATRNLGFELSSKWGDATLDLTNIADYVYFDENSKPKQFDDAIVYMKLKIHKEVKFGKFALDNTLLYQNVSSGTSVFRVPDFVTRNTFYYADDWFKGKPIFVNIGLTFNYFTKYKMNAYDPLLAEFNIQNNTEIGFPTLDFFFNARVRRTRIFFKIDNATSYWTKKNYFSAPNYPYRDFSVRFGVVWNWFI